MGIITKAVLLRFFEEHPEMALYPLAQGDSLSTEAQEYLEKRRQEKRFAKPRGGGDWSTPESYIIEGRRVDVKPEGMTHLYENVLVYKDDARIILRGLLDTFQARLIEAQHLVRAEAPNLIAPLEEILAYTRLILGHEVLNTPLPQRMLLGMSLEELNRRSHAPHEYFGMPQMVLLSCEDGLAPILLNRLRAEIREVEIAALKAFRRGSIIERPDIMEALNRLSSAFHLLMYQELSRRQK